MISQQVLTDLTLVQPLRSLLERGYQVDHREDNVKVLVTVQKGLGGVLVETDSAVDRAVFCRVLSEEVTYKLKPTR